MEFAMLSIRPLLSKLGDLLAGEFALEKRVRKGVESLSKEMLLMQAALGKVAKVPPEELDEEVKIWAGMVRDLAYQMEDIVDVFIVCVGDLSASPKNRVKKFLKKTCKLFKKGIDLHRIYDALEEAVTRAKQSAELRQRYELETLNTRIGASIDPRTIALYTDVRELAGIEEPRDELINKLLQGDDWSKNPLKTVSVVGFGGLGKTTLAKTVYDKIKVQFECSAFVSVSRNPNMKKILKNILFELDKKMHSNIHNTSREEKHLIDELIEFLNDKRYLIVIDDIWNENAWQFIKCAFSKNSLGSRVITTTRIFSVSEACCSSAGDIYRMKPLSDDVSRRLFYERVFSSDKGCPHDLMEVSKHILKKCGGIPLAVITMVWKCGRTLAKSLSNLHKLEVLQNYVKGGCVDLMREGWVPSPEIHRLRIIGCSLQTLSAWINPSSSLPLLSYLAITVSEVRSEDTQLLGMLRALRYLDLRVEGNFSGENHVVEIMSVVTNAFPCATECYFVGIVSAPSIFPQGAAPRLKELCFDFPAMWIGRADYNLSMGHLPSLEAVYVCEPFV
ncbi:disease resistance protein RGA5 [Triticum aestivum]|uniref:disease resistance protein RGA5 n=1 Tax=Triticum aestivum TaxID=4565 RepID=UPI001D027BB8|nr:disease resistance protein RGA5-like [Triticum aestivum]